MASRSQPSTITGIRLLTAIFPWGLQSRKRKSTASEGVVGSMRTGRTDEALGLGRCSMRATVLATAARPDSERSECAVLREHEVPGPHLGDRLQAAVGHLDRGVRTEAFVEPVARELLHQLPDALGLRSGGAALAAAADELLALLRHQLAVL